MQPAGQEVSLKQHLKGFSAVKLPAESAIGVLEKHLKRHGSVTRKQFAEFRDAVNYMLPLKSFTTRFVILGLDGWAIFFSDMKGESCYVDAFAVSRASQCDAISVILQETRRELHVLEAGRKVRQVQSLSDGDEWYYREEGPLQPFEEVGESLRCRRVDRLSVEALERYFRAFTGFPVPNWGSQRFTSLFGLERSTKDLRVPLLEFQTAQDLFSH